MEAAYHAWAEALPLHYGSLEVAQSAAPMPSLIFKLRGDEFQVRMRSQCAHAWTHVQCTSPALTIPCSQRYANRLMREA